MKSGTIAAYCENGLCRLEGLVHAAEADAVSLCGELRDAVRRDRVEEQGLVDRELGLRAVDRRGRGEDHAPHAFVAGGEQHVEGALDVDGARGERILDGAGNRAERAQVEDDLGAADRVVDALVAAQLAFDDLDLEAREVGAVAGREVVEHADVVAPLEQVANEVRADEAAAAGNDDFHAHASGDSGHVTGLTPKGVRNRRPALPVPRRCAVAMPLPDMSGV
jgi:hypothetical protein